MAVGLFHSQAGIHARSRGDPVAPTWKGAQARKLPSSNQTLASDVNCLTQWVQSRGGEGEGKIGRCRGEAEGAIDRTRGEAE